MEDASQPRGNGTHQHGTAPVAARPIEVAILTCSDRCARGERADVGGPTLHNLVIDRIGGVVRQYRVVADERGPIEAAIREWADDHRLDLILTTGGTGLAMRDVTPDATRAACDREVPAIAQAMVVASLRVTPYAMLSRATAGIRRRTLVVNLPGNPKALAENFDAIAEVIPHAIDIIRGVDTHAHRGHQGGHRHASGPPAPSSPVAIELGEATASRPTHQHRHGEPPRDVDGPIARNVGGPPC